MSRQNKIILGIASFWPLVWIYLVFAFAILTLFIVMLMGGDYQTITPWVFMILSPFNILWVANIIVLLFIYGIDLFRRDPARLDIEKKILWAAALLLAPPFAMPAYWYFYIWSDKVED